MSFDLLVRSVNVLAGAMSARVPVAFVDVVRAIRPGKAGCTRALVAVLQRQTLGPVSTRRRGAVVLSFAVLAWNTQNKKERMVEIHDEPFTLCTAYGNFDRTL